MSKWQTAQFKNALKEWNQKLKEAGFEDIEEEKGGERYLKQYASSPFNDANEETLSAKSTYFSLITEWVNKETKFEGESTFQLILPFPGISGYELKRYSSPDRMIMEMTAEGKTIAEISRELKLRKMQKHNRDTIRYIRRRYEDKWGIKRWEKEQMVSRRVRTR